MYNKCGDSMKKDLDKIVEKYFNKPSLQDARSRKDMKIDKIEYMLEEQYKTIGQGFNYMVKTYGCQGNEADSEKLVGMLEHMQFKPANKDEDADVILLNTCAVRENAENRIWGVLGSLKNLKKINPNLIIGICGCMPQEESVVDNLLQKFPYVDIIMGTHNIHMLPRYISHAYMEKERVVDVWSNQGNIVENTPVIRNDRVKAYVNIMYGCDEFCTYCIVPYTRGKERSRMPHDIVNEIKELVKNGYKEVTLLGQNVNAYGDDLEIDVDFAKLLYLVDETGIERFTFTTSHPKDLDDATIDAFGKLKNIMHFLHLPVQSGNNEVLRKMNRKYTVESYKEKIARLRSILPDISISTDIIVGFPGETVEQFEDTLNLVRTVKFDGAYTFAYSKREGTPAAKMEECITNESKMSRLHKLIDVVNGYFYEGNKRFLNKEVSVLVEGISKNNNEFLTGHTNHNKLINFPGTADLIGKIVKVKVVEAKTWSLKGELLDE